MASFQSQNRWYRAIVWFDERYDKTTRENIVSFRVRKWHPWWMYQKTKAYLMVLWKEVKSIRIESR